MRVARLGLATAFLPGTGGCHEPLAKPSITFMVKRMEEAGFVQRQTEAGDLRRFRLTLTRSGRKAMEAARSILDGAFGRRLARLSAGERAELARILARLTEEHAGPR